MCDGHPGAGRSPWAIFRWDADLGSRALCVVWADGPQSWRRRAYIRYWKRLTGFRVRGDRFEEWLLRKPSWARKPCALCGVTGPKAGADGLMQDTGSI